MPITFEDLRRMIKGVILDTPPCPDGRGGLACASCLASQITLELALVIGMEQQREG